MLNTTAVFMHLFNNYLGPTEPGAGNTDEQTRKCPCPGEADILREKQTMNNTTYDVISSSDPCSEEKNKAE